MNKQRIDKSIRCFNNRIYTPLYAGILVRGQNAFIDEIFMIQALSDSIRSGAKTCVGSNVPRKLRLNTNSITAFVKVVADTEGSY